MGKKFSCIAPEGKCHTVHFILTFFKIPKFSSPCLSRTFCTKRIRCERATALLNQMVAASEDPSTTIRTKNDDNDNEPTATNKTNSHPQEKQETKNQTSSATTPVITCKPKGVYELRGGIERYVKTFPQGGFWKGKNYLFDR